MVGGEDRPASSIPMVSSLKLTAPLSVGQAAQCRIECKLYPGVTIKAAIVYRRGGSYS